MSDHGLCLHEADFANMAKDSHEHEVDLAKMAKDISYIRKSLDKINSLPTKVALHEQSISRLWWMVGGVAVVVMGVLIKTLI